MRAFRSRWDAPARRTRADSALTCAVASRRSTLVTENCMHTRVCRSAVFTVVLHPRATVLEISLPPARRLGWSIQPGRRYRAFSPIDERFIMYFLVCGCMTSARPIRPGARFRRSRSLVVTFPAPAPVSAASRARYDSSVQHWRARGAAGESPCSRWSRQRRDLSFRTRSRSAKVSARCRETQNAKQRLPSLLARRMSCSIHRDAVLTPADAESSA
jgi:hypothetical protein